MKLFTTCSGCLFFVAMASSEYNGDGDRGGVRSHQRRHLDEDEPPVGFTITSFEMHEHEHEHEHEHSMMVKAEKKFKADKVEKGQKKVRKEQKTDKLDKADKKAKTEKEAKTDKKAKKTDKKAKEHDKLPKFAKDMKVDKKHDINELAEIVIPTEPEDDYYYDDKIDMMDDVYFEECLFDYMPVVNGTEKCLRTFLDSTFIKIDIDNALDCTESLEKAFYLAYPICFSLESYEPKLCNDLFWLADEFWMCMEELIDDDYYMYDDAYDMEDDYTYCYFDYEPSENMPGCVYAFAGAVGLDAESLLNCTDDLYEVLSDVCYSNYKYDDVSTSAPFEFTEACLGFEQCQSLAMGFQQCPYYYYYSSPEDSDNVNMTEIVEAEMNVDDIWSMIYNGSVAIEAVYAALDDFSNTTVVSEWQWSHVMQCLDNYLGWIVDDVCYYKEEIELLGGCYESFADSVANDGGFFDINLALNCTLGYWSIYYEYCYDNDESWQELDTDACRALDRCRSDLEHVEQCFGAGTGYDMSNWIEELEADSVIGEILAATYNGTVDEEEAFAALQGYGGCWAQEDGWDDFVMCMEPRGNYNYRPTGNPSYLYDPDPEYYTYAPHTNEPYGYEEVEEEAEWEEEEEVFGV
eukprot:jgi/Psemu1/68576/estExt_Genemark1.C_5300019